MGSNEITANESSARRASLLAPSCPGRSSHPTPLPAQSQTSFRAWSRTPSVALALVAVVVVFALQQSGQKTIWRVNI
jgi:hypothetical protein